MPNPVHRYINSSFFVHTVKLFQALLYNSYNSTSVICLHTLCSIWFIDRNVSSATHSRSEWTWEQWQWKGTPHSPNLQSWNLTIKWFYVIPRTLIGGGLTPLQRCSQCILQSQLTEQSWIHLLSFIHWWKIHCKEDCWIYLQWNYPHRIWNIMFLMFW